MFSKQEIKDLAISTVVLALIFSSFNLEILPMTILIVILVFISHEMAHKFVAQRYGCFAEYRKWNTGLILGLVFSFFGTGFAAPGAVYITPFNKKKFAFSIARLGKKEYALISLAGPAVNIVIGISAFILNIFYPITMLALVTRISLFLSLFNLIPFPPLDGFKIYRWNNRIWGAAFAISLLGLFV